MNSAAPLPTKVRFGAFEVHIRAGELLKSGIRVRLQKQPFELLTVLLENSGELVTREELRQKIWPRETFVDFDLALNTAVKKVRVALGDPADSPQFIETLHGRGYRFIGRLEPPASGDSKPQVQSSTISQSRGLIVLAISLLVAIATVVGAVEFRRRNHLHHDFVYIAVVPFETLSSDPNQQYLGTGITELLTADLTKIKSLRVISNKDGGSPSDQGSQTGTPQVARAVKVDVILKGSVARSGDRIRITARLLEAGTGKHLWAENYERDLRDLLLLEGQVAQAIAEAVRVTLTPTETARLKGGPRSPAAQEAYLKGIFYENQGTCNAFGRAADEFHYAIAQDSQFAEAYAALAGDYYGLGDWGCVSQKEAWPKAKALALKAIELDEGDADVHANLADIEFIYDWDWEAADREYKRALDLDPQVSSNRALFLFAMHRRVEAFSEIDRELRFDPLDQSNNAQMGYILYLDKQYDRAIEQFQKTIEMYPQSEMAHKWLSISYEQQGNLDAAFRTALKLQEIAGYSPSQLSRLRNGYASGGLRRFYQEELYIDKERAKPGEFDKCGEPEAYLRFGEKLKTLDCLEDGYRNHTLPVDRLNSDAQFDPLRSEQRFQNLLQRIGLPKS
jgi:TolB-like protein/DNA-binding winged helix-turn-helix (wHTH) protein/Flp pilus assembly protein TadD